MTGHVACMGGWEMCAELRLESLRERVHSQDLGIEGRIIKSDS